MGIRWQRTPTSVQPPPKGALRAPVRQLKHLVRTKGSIRKHHSREREHVVSLFLNEIGTRGARVLSPVKFGIGEEVALTLEYPERFLVYGKILWCGPQLRNSRVLSGTGPKYLVVIRYITFLEEQVMGILGFCSRVAEKIVA